MFIDKININLTLEIFVCVKKYFFFVMVCVIKKKKRIVHNVGIRSLCAITGWILQETFDKSKDKHHLT